MALPPPILNLMEFHKQVINDLEMLESSGEISHYTTRDEGNARAYTLYQGEEVGRVFVSQDSIPANPYLTGQYVNYMRVLNDKHPLMIRILGIYQNRLSDGVSNISRYVAARYKSDGIDRNFPLAVSIGSNPQVPGRVTPDEATIPAARPDDPPPDFDLMEHLKKLFPDSQNDILRRYRTIIEEINAQIARRHWLTRSETYQEIERDIHVSDRQFKRDLKAIEKADSGLRLEGKSGLIHNADWFGSKNES